MQKKSKRSPALIKAQEKYAKKLKESGRAMIPVTVLFKPDELERIDEERGDESRNAYLRLKIMGDWISPKQVS